MSRNERSWKQWFDKDAPEEAQIPDGYHISLDSFRKLLLIRSAVDNFTCVLIVPESKSSFDANSKPASKLTFKFS